MKTTRATTLLTLAVVGGVIAYLLELLVQAWGSTLIIAPLSLSLTLIALALAVVGAAIPVRRSVTGKRKAPIDPFFALRVAVFAKASSRTGALLLGAAVGVLIFLFGRPILPAFTMSALTIAQLIGAALLVAGGLVAEFLCKLPPQDPQDPLEERAREPAA
jgi:hypothetical protein